MLMRAGPHREILNYAAAAFCFANERFPFYAFRKRPNFVSTKQWEDTGFLDYSVNKAAVD